MAAPQTKPVAGLWNTPNEKDVALLRRSIWKARCFLHTMWRTWSMNDKALSDLVEASKKLEIAHEFVLQYRIDLGEIWSGEPMEQETAQLDFTLDTPDSPPVEE